jgi:hypothetical protein
MKSQRSKESKSREDTINIYFKRRLLCWALCVPVSVCESPKVNYTLKRLYNEIINMHEGQYLV